MTRPIARKWMWSAAVLVALATLAAGIVAALERPARYSASASVLITPPAGDAGLAVTGSDTLSRGTIVATYAEAYASGRIVALALEGAGIAAGDAQTVTVETRVLAGTSIISVTATAPTGPLAEKAAQAVAAYTPELAGYSLAFTPSIIEDAAGSAQPAGPSFGLLVAMLIALALATGAVVFSGLSRIGRGGRDHGIPPRTDAPPRAAR